MLVNKHFATYRCFHKPVSYYAEQINTSAGSILVTKCIFIGTFLVHNPIVYCKAAQPACAGMGNVLHKVTIASLHENKHWPQHRRHDLSVFSFHHCAAKGFREKCLLNMVFYISDYCSRLLFSSCQWICHLDCDSLTTVTTSTHYTSRF